MTPLRGDSRGTAVKGVVAGIIGLVVGVTWTIGGIVWANLSREEEPV